MKTCLYCDGKLVQRRISYTFNHHNYQLTIDELPAWVCEQCGKPLFDEATVDTIQAILSQNYLVGRIKRGSWQVFQQILAFVPDVEPEPYDQL